MITKVSNSISNLKNLWIELFIDKTNKVTNVADGSILNATAYGTAKVAQKAIKDIAIVESQIFPESATGTLLDKSAALFGVTPRKGALGSSTYVRVLASPGTMYGLSTYFIAKNGTRFVVDKELIVDTSGYGYVSVKSTVTGSSTNVEANSITQVTPRPLTHIECINEYQAIGGRDYEDDETFRTRIKNNDNKLSKGTVEYWTQVFQDLDSKVLRVINVGLGEDAKTHIYLVTQNGSFFTEDELSILLAKASPYFGLFEIDLSGNSIGIVLENAEWMYVGGAMGVDFRVELTPGSEITTVRKNIQIALTKYLDFRFWSPGKTVQWDDLLQVVKTAAGVKYVPDEFFNPFYDETVPLNQLPRIRGFIMRDLNGLVLFDAGSALSNIFYPARDSSIYTGQQSQTLSQTQVVQVTVTNTRGAAVEGAVFSVGGKIVITNSEGQVQLLLENGEYDYTLSKNGWNQQTGSFIVLNAQLSIIINDFAATLQTVSFEVLQVSTPMKDVTIAISNQTLVTNSEGQASINLEPGTYSYSLIKVGYTSVLNAVVIDTLPVQITEYMFPQAQTVSFSVIDRERDIFVPNASVWVQNITEDTDNNGQAEMNLIAGSYNLIIQRPGYLQHKETIDISNIEKNCILVELTAIPYQTSFTVLDQETSLPITSASVAINEGRYTTNNQGIAIVSLPDGSYPYEVVKSGFSLYSGTVLVNGGETGVVIRMNKAFWKTTFIIRDIDTGFFLQGALANINDKSGLSDINGEAEFLLPNGTYTYGISLAEYKPVSGEVIVLDQDTKVDVFMKLKGRIISFTVKDSITKVAIPQTSIVVTDRGTGEVIGTLNTDSEGATFIELDRGGYNFISSNQYYFDKTGTFDVDLLDFSIEILMDIKPININVLIETSADIVGDSTDPGQITGATAKFTSLSTGEIFLSPLTKVGGVEMEILPDTYECQVSGPGIVTQTELNVAINPTFTEKIFMISKLTKIINIFFKTTIPETDEDFVFYESFFVDIGCFNTSLNQRERMNVYVSSVSNGNVFISGSFILKPAIYKFFPAFEKENLSFFNKYYKNPINFIEVKEDSPQLLYVNYPVKTEGYFKFILKNTDGEYLPIGEVFSVTLNRIVPGDFPYTKTYTLTSVNQNGIVLIEQSEVVFGEYQVTVESLSGHYKPLDLFTIEIKGFFMTALELKENRVTILVQVRCRGFLLQDAKVQIRDLDPPTILAGPITTSASGEATLSLFARNQDAKLNVLAGSSWSEYLQTISLRKNQSIKIDLASTFLNALEIFSHYEPSGNLKVQWEPSTDIYVNWEGDTEIFYKDSTGANHSYNTAGTNKAKLYSKNLLRVNCTGQTAVTSIETFGNVLGLRASDSGLVSVEVRASSDLDTFECNNCRLTSVDLILNSKLKQINIKNNALTDFRIGVTASDAICDLSQNLLSSFDIRTSRIKNLYLQDNPLSVLNIQNSVSLRSLNCQNTKLEILTLPQLIVSVYCMDSLLTAIETGNNPNLEILNVTYNKLAYIDITLNAGIKALRCGNNILTSLDLSKNIALQYLFCESNRLTALDLSKNTSLFNISCFENPFILDDTALIAFANSLVNRSSSSTAGTLIINNAEQAIKINSICTDKNWTIS